MSKYSTVIHKISENSDHLTASAKTYGAAGFGFGIANLDEITGYAQAILVFLSIFAVGLRIYSDMRSLKKNKKGKK